MPDNYAYINARIRAMHSGLITEKLEETLNATDLTQPGPRQGSLADRAAFMAWARWWD